MSVSKRTGNLLWIPALVVGALQMAHVDAGALTMWGADFFGPIALYGSIRSGGSILQRFLKRPPSPPLLSSLSFDPVDLAAYVAGVAVALGGEKALRARQADVVAPS